MTKAKVTASPYHCGECGWEATKWVGRCGECQAWGTVVERTAPKSRVQAGPVTQKALPIGEIPIEDSQARTSGVPELDRVLGGGLVPGAAILLAGEPGVGKSTLLLEVAAQTAAQKHRTLYLTGEESAAQVRLRADRTGGIQDELYLAAETDLGAVLGHVEQVKPTLLVIDSIQTISASDIDGVPGGVTQVKEVAAALIRMAKLRNITLVLVGHVTKDGSIAGPRVLEHLVDVVLHFEGERSSRLRMVRAVKNRFGPVDEVGCFDLSAAGIDARCSPRSKRWSLTAPANVRAGRPQGSTRHG
jgi:DNA repair protein RadA/Sms